MLTRGPPDLARHRGRTPAGIYARRTHQPLAMAARIWRTRQASTATKRSLTTHDN